MQQYCKISLCQVSEIMKTFFLIGFLFLLLLFENSISFDAGELDALWDEFKVRSFKKVEQISKNFY